MKKNILVVLVLTCVFGGDLVGQNKLFPKTLTLAQQQEDFRVFRGSLEEIHVGLNWFISDKELRESFDRAYASLTEDERTEDFYLKLRHIMASIRHGHNGVALPQEYGVNFRLALLERDKKFFPFAIRILDKRIFIVVNTSANEKMKVGTEIVSINGEKSSKILERMLPLMPSSGDNETFRVGKLENYYEFHYLYNLMNRGGERFKVEVIPFGSKNRQTFEIEGELPQTISERYERIKGKSISDYSEVLKYKVLDGRKRIGYLRIGSFYSGLAKNYKEFLDRSFTEIRNAGIENLIVDLRQNEGGGEGFWQMAYVYTTGNSLPESDGQLFVKGDKFSFLSNVENPTAEFSAFANNPYDIIEKTTDGRFRLKPQFRSDDAVSYPVPPNAFSGKLYLLTDGMTFSAATAYVSTVRFDRPSRGRYARVIGEQPGEDFDAGVSSVGTLATIVLPNSRIKVNIPLLGSDGVPYSKKQKVRLPDYRILPTAKDLAEGVDAELEFATSLIRKGP